LACLPTAICEQSIVDFQKISTTATNRILTGIDGARESIVDAVGGIQTKLDEVLLELPVIIGSQTAALEAGLTALGADLDAALGIQTAAIVAAVATSSTPVVQGLELLIEAIKSKDQPNLTNTLNMNANKLLEEIQNQFQMLKAVFKMPSTTETMAAQQERLANNLKLIINQNNNSLIDNILQSTDKINNVQISGQQAVSELLETSNFNTELISSSSVTNTGKIVDQISKQMEQDVDLNNKLVPLLSLIMNSAYQIDDQLAKFYKQSGDDAQRIIDANFNNSLRIDNTIERNFLSTQVDTDTNQPTAKILTQILNKN